MVDLVVDAIGLKCPLPILRAHKSLKKLSKGETMRVFSSDPGSVKDFEVFCRETGNELLRFEEKRGVFSFLIRRNN